MKVEPRHLRAVVMPRGVSLPDHFARPDEVVGLIATQKALAGEILLKQRFADRTSGSILAALVRPDRRAVTVRVDDVVGVAGFLMPGNHVDVVAARMTGDRRAESTTVLTDLVVLAVDQTAAQDKDKPVVVRAVTLEVTPAQAEVLVKAREEGKIQLTLRNPFDEAPAPTVAGASPATVAAATVTTGPPAPDPARSERKPVRRGVPAAPNQDITIIRGTNVRSADGAP
jgi:pilus assembly protein CpaB